MPNLTSLLHFHACERENGMKMEEEVESRGVRAFFELFIEQHGVRICETAVQYLKLREKSATG